MASTGAQSALSPEGVIEGKDQLIDYIAAGEKPRGAWRIGTEHEKFGFRMDDRQPLTYEGARGVRAILEAMRDRYNWVPIMEGDYIIGLKKEDRSISLEPGGQLELSGGLLDNLHQSCAEVQEYQMQVRSVCEELGVRFLGLGFIPTARREDVPVMPKGRYVVMRNYMPKVGNLGLDMMLRTATIQTNLDFSSEADMVQKFRVSLALQPVATALFANSPFTEGQPNGFKSYRSHVWTDTDADRSGMLPFVFEDGMGYEAYVDYLLNVPMYFVYREGRYIDAAGKSFKDFMAGRLDGFEGQIPTMKDWEDHMSTVFPEVRLKKFLEMRGADGGPWQRICALPAFWVGLLYDQGALDAAWDLVKDWTAAERQQLRDDVPRMALDAPCRSGQMREFAKEVLAIAREGLRRRARLNSNGEDERHFLNDLEWIVEVGRTPADELLKVYNEKWGQDISPIFEEFAC
ncbi:MAG: glutamate--cysteine ligase [Kordiimonas sp.]|mgnify:CR=1 FL=1|nr:glutamate--cysteine ligase [Kordiimonas sp.]